VNKLVVLAIRELKSIFYSPIAYVVGAIFALLHGYTFWILVNVVNNPMGEVSENMVELLFGGTLFFWLGILIIIPIITMRTISEEKKSGTIELLFTSPLSDFEIILAKFLGVFCFYVLLWVPTFFHIAFIAIYGKALDYNVVFTSYLATFLTGAVMISFGIMFSCLTKNQIIAAVLTFAALVAMFSIGFVNLFSQSAALTKVLNYVWVIGHFQDFTKGLVDIKRIVYYMSLIGFNIFLSVQILGSRNWKN